MGQQLESVTLTEKSITSLTIKYGIYDPPQKPCNLLHLTRFVATTLMAQCVTFKGI